MTIRSTDEPNLQRYSLREELLPAKERIQVRILVLLRAISSAVEYLTCNEETRVRLPHCPQRLFGSGDDPEPFTG